MNIKSPVCYDISHWKTVADFAAISPRPLLIITKATEGVGFVDSTFTVYYPAIKRAGYGRGVFHFFRKNYEAEKQARHFVETIRPYTQASDLLVLDFEEGGETAAQLLTFLEYVQFAYPANIVMQYSRKVLMDAIPMTENQKARMKAFPVWTAGYPTDPDLYDSVPPFYVPDQTKYAPVWLWQYTDHAHVTGIDGDVDANWIHPTLEKIIGVEQPTTGEPMDRYRVTWEKGCNKRVAPNVSNTPVGTIALGLECDIMGYFVPDGVPETVERWGRLADGYWIALTYASQPRAVLATAPPTEPPAPAEPFPAEIGLTIGGVTKQYVVKP